jgi:hypothetical protein
MRFARHDLVASIGPALEAPLRVRLAVLKSPTDPKRDVLKSAEEIMQMLEAFDLTGLCVTPRHSPAARITPSLRRSLRVRRDKLTGLVAVRPQLIDDFLPKLEEWMERSKGQIRADVAYEKLIGLGFHRLETHPPAGCREAAGRVQVGARCGRLARG